jgi:hypothetical protein
VLRCCKFATARMFPAVENKSPAARVGLRFDSKTCLVAGTGFEPVTFGL